MISSEQILARVAEIPPLPDVVFQVLRLSNSPKASAKDFVEVIQLDPGITTKVLRLSNSAYFGLPQTVSSLHQAAVYIGINEIVNLVIIGCVNSAYDAPQPGYGLAKGDLWRHSVAVAIASRRLAKKTNYGDPQVAFTGGLLHDLGKLILHEYVHQNLDEIQAVVEQKELNFFEAEEKVIGINHCDVGRIVAEKWNLPESLRDAIQLHHAPKLDVEDADLVALVHIANILCLDHMIGGPIIPQVTEYDPSALEHVNLDAEKLEAEVEPIREDFENANDLLLEVNST